MRVYLVKKLMKVLPVPVSKDCEHPKPPTPNIPNHEFTMGLIAPKGAGKTTLIANLLHGYKGYFHDIFIFSPTVRSDEKWDWIKQQPLLSENKPLKAWIKKEEQRRNGALQNEVVGKPTISSELADRNTNEKEQFDGKIPEENYYHQYTDEDLDTILRRQDALIVALKKYDKPKYLADRILLIFDDLVGSALFSNKKDNLFKGFNSRHRHYSASVIMVSQGYKEIPKTVRSNWTALVIFAISNDKETSVIYEENTMNLKFKDWMAIFNHCISEPYGFMYLNAKSPPGYRIMKNFDKFIQYKSED